MALALLVAVGLLVGLVGCPGIPKDIGVKNGRLAPCPNKPNCVSSQAAPADETHSIAPLTYDDPQLEAMARLVKVLEGMARTEVITREERYLHAEVTSLIFRFVDDVEFYFPKDAKVVHCRSASRVGYGDMGVNRKRIEAIRAAFAR